MGTISESQQHALAKLTGTADCRNLISLLIKMQLPCMLHVDGCPVLNGEDIQDLAFLQLFLNEVTMPASV